MNKRLNKKEIKSLVNGDKVKLVFFEDDGSKFNSIEVVSNMSDLGFEGDQYLNYVKFKDILTDGRIIDQSDESYMELFKTNSK